jgi:hypothetical protein
MVVVLVWIMERLRFEGLDNRLSPSHSRICLSSTYVCRLVFIEDNDVVVAVVVGDDVISVDVCPRDNRST